MPRSGVDTATLFFSMLGGFISYPAFCAVFRMYILGRRLIGEGGLVEFAQVF